MDGLSSIGVGGNDCNKSEKTEADRRGSFRFLLDLLLL
jgi:hypothetical protein